MKERYINPFTDFGFKKLFGEETNKYLLIDFLNKLLQDKGKITDLIFLKTENLGVTETDRKAICDLYCQNEKGEKFIANYDEQEQRAYQDNLKYYRDLKNVMNTAIEETLDKKLLQIAQSAIAKGLDNPRIADLTGLSTA